MCRLFGFRSVIRSQVHRSLLSAENALLHQSTQHPDGWGVGYYHGGVPHVIKSAATAFSDRVFHRISGVVSSETVVAHLRKATQGTLNTLNAHPFQHGRWVFAHNGNVAEMDELRPRFLQEIHPSLQRFLLGETDSELLFLLLLDRLSQRVSLYEGTYPLAEAAKAVRETLDLVTSWTGGISQDPARGADGTYLTFLLTNGQLLLGHQGGMPLYWSTHKHLCPERDNCPSYGLTCERPAPPLHPVAHLIFSSEPLQGENVWTPMEQGELLGVDERMRLHPFGTPTLAASAI